MKPLHAQTLFCCAILSLLSPLPAAAWNHLTVFGDSLSDGGNVGRFTYDGATHPLYDEIVAQSLGDTLRPSSQGGNNYAEGGAVAVPAINPLFNTQDQLQSYLATRGGRADPDGLYIHWIGGNDLAAAALSPLTARQLVDNSAGAAASQVSRLLDAGAGTVIVPTVPNVGATPALLQAILQTLGPAAQPATAALFQSLSTRTTPDRAAREQAIETALGEAAGQLSAIPPIREALAQQLIAAWRLLSEAASALTDRYNQAEEEGLLAARGNIARVDINGLFNEVIDNPVRYGLTNTAGMACPPGVSSMDCTASTPGFSSSQQYLFADRLHPSPAVHALIADYIQSVLNAPLQVAALSRAPSMLVGDAQNTLDGHLQQQRQQPAEAGTLTVFGGYAGQQRDFRGDSLLNGDATSATGTVGVGYQLTDAWQAGAMLSTTSQRQQPSSRFDYRLRGNLVAIWSQLNYLNHGWINADAHYADLDFDDIKRQVKLGPATRTEQGNSGGKVLGMRVQTGWDLPVGRYVTTGPVASYALDYTRVGGYQEEGNSSTSMRFGDQTLHAQVGSLGWRIDSKDLPVNPWAQISYNHQFGDSDSAVTAGLKSTRTAFTRSSDGRDDNWINMAVGASVPLGAAVNAFAGVSAVAGNSETHQVTWNVGVNARF
ncbi:MULTISPECIES: autotransporter outer membrane beta-barrel domain-containing protein [unclassified Pantoea]|uniref:autotransporter outer membrane beta-barrel domain-containing protein n=1 Tax=unclassified Pantoea TaxID=2630326 RepID=UPI0012319CA7|nr:MULTISPECIES: autotransporter domain-containing protein [unclassified Pantoea]KAA5974449.1 autotransporter domain-containing protein [Pantoea sp. M_6]KAA5978288.1 autotransporter domain-containing protein [Pantoea sp. M_8]KAA5989957.1 autotransporter domain-containing protein [Pantoea sp. M_10]KAA6002814.1 autotransporter domain-containing protein [Pantoea sp. M_5]